MKQSVFGMHQALLQNCKTAKLQNCTKARQAKFKQAALVALERLFILPQLILQLHNLLVCLKTPAENCEHLGFLYQQVTQYL
jgi:hypothetical protein